MRIEIDVSSGKEAAAAVAGLDLAPAPDFLAAYFTEGLDARTVATELSRRGAGALHGGTSCRGVMSSAGMRGDGPVLGTFALYDPDGDYGTSMTAKGGDPRKSARRAAIEALGQAGRRGEVPDLVWLTAAPGAEEEIIAGLQDEMGTDVPIVGGSAADDTGAGNWRVISAAGALDDGIVVSVLFPSRPIALAFHSGFVPTSQRARVTRADGRRIVTLDGRPAAGVLAQWAGRAEPAKRNGGRGGILSDMVMTPLGRIVGHVAGVPYYLLAHPMAVHADGSVELFAAVGEGEELVMMHGSEENLAGRAGRVARQSLGIARGQSAPTGALMVYCGGCRMAVAERMGEVATSVGQALGGAPFLGVFTFGEQGRIGGDVTRHGNMMIGCVSFGV